MSLLEKQVTASLNENALNKRLVNNSYKAVVDANKFKETSRKPQKIIYGKSSLLDKIITSNLNENAVNKRLEQISYSAIDGQRQTGTPYAPEGVQMLGQMGREKPLTAITKEMIKDYQEEEQKPFMVDGEARKYMKADYQPILQVPQSLDEIKDDIRIVYKNKVATAKTIKDAEEYLKTADEYYRGLIRDINVFGMTDAKQKEKEQTERHILQEKMKYDKLRNQMDKYEYELKRLMNEGKEIKRQNALIPEKNREEVAKYEQSLLQSNRNRLNLQQQPYESDMDYYKRLQEIEKEKVNPALYKQYSVNKASFELKPKLENLFKDESMIEGVIKSLSENDKMIINKNFDKIEKEFINKYGYNPSMNTKMAVNAVLEPLADTSSKIKALIQRKNAQDLYIPDLKSKQESEAQQDAFETLKGVFKRKKIEPKYARVVEKSRQIEEEKAQQGKDDLALARSKQQAKMDETANQKKAIETLRGVFKRKKIEPEYAKVVEKSRQIEGENRGRSARVIQRAISKYAKRSVAAKREKSELAKKMLEEYSPQSTIAELRTSPAKTDKFPLYILPEELKKREDAIKIEKALQRRQKILEGQEAQQEEASTTLQQYFKDIKDRYKLREAVRREIAERKPIYVSSPTTASALSGATTVAEQAEARLRKPRSDIGLERGPYTTSKSVEKQFMKTLTPEEQSAWWLARRHKIKQTQFVKETMKQRQDTQGAKGSGLKRKTPQKRRAKVSLDEKKKDRLQLVAAQIKAGNTNPRLIVELNKLYKDLYGINDAIMLLK